MKSALNALQIRNQSNWGRGKAATGDFSVPWTWPAGLGTPHSEKRDISGQNHTDLICSQTSCLLYQIKRSSMTAP